MRTCWKPLGHLALLGIVGGTLLLVAAKASGTRRTAPPVADDRVAPAAATAQEIFERRIMPIFNSPRPSSCTQCHLAGIDLKNYILPSHELTFLSLRDQGLVDLDRPADSRILRMIRMGAEDQERAARIRDEVRRAEYEAFAEWIALSSRDPKLRAAPRVEPVMLAQAQKPAADKELTPIEKSFRDTVWGEKNRCASCHEAGGKDTAKWTAKYGARVNWIKKGPKETLDYLVKAKLLDAARPERSLLLTKPMNLVEHVGGIKIKPGDECHKTFLTFLKEYAANRADKTQADAPPDKPKPDDKKPAAERKSIDLDVDGLESVDDNLKLSKALNAVSGVKLVVINRKKPGPSKVRVDYEDQEPELKGLIDAAAKAGYKAAKTGS